MTPRLLFRPEARTELQDAQAWYEARSVGLGSEFARAVSALLGAITRMPEAFPVADPPLRRALMRRFPYALIYAVAKGEIVIVACQHHRQHPDRWRGRDRA